MTFERKGEATRLEVREGGLAILVENGRWFSIGWGRLGWVEAGPEGLVVTWDEDEWTGGEVVTIRHTATYPAVDPEAVRDTILEKWGEWATARVEPSGGGEW